MPNHKILKFQIKNLISALALVPAATAENFRIEGIEVQYRTTATEEEEEEGDEASRTCCWTTTNATSGG